SGTLGTPQAAAYNASKWGLTGLIKSLAEEGRERGIFCAVVLPGSTDTEMLKKTPFEPELQPGDVAQVVRWLAAEAPFALSGGALAERGGIVLSLEKMDRILEVSRADMVCVVQPGVVLENLQKAVEEQGLFYPPDPNSQAWCSIGGNLAHNAGGPRALKYGVTS